MSLGAGTVTRAGEGRDGIRGTLWSVEGGGGLEGGGLRGSGWNRGPEVPAQQGRF